MAVEIDTASSHTDLFNRLVAFLEDTIDGPGWTLLGYDTANVRALFMAEGLSGGDEIFFGFSVHADVPTDSYAIGMWMFKAYNPALDELAQPGYSGIAYLPVWNTTTPYWFVANGQRLIVVAKVSTTYQAAYVGKFLPYGTPGEYGLPYYRGLPVPTATTRWSTVSEDHRNFWDPGNSALICRPDGAWTAIQNFRELNGESDMDFSNYIWPYAGNISSGNVRARYRELRENLDGTYSLLPLVMHGENPANDIYGELDGAYAVNGFNNASENLVQIGGVDYLVVQNMHRTARYYYCAIKLE